MITDGGVKQLQAYKSIKHILIFQEVPPHTRLNLHDLANKLDMSITPVRDALITLANEGLVRRESDKSFYSKPLDAAVIQSDYEMVVVVLKQSIETSIMRFSMMDFPDPYPVFKIQDPNIPDNVRARAEYIEALFLKIASASNNHHFPQIMQTLTDRTSFIRQLDVRQAGRIDGIADDFADLIASLKRSDARAALANLERQYGKKVDLLHHLVAEANLKALKSEQTWSKLRL